MFPFWCQAHRGFDRAVPATDHQNAVARYSLGVDQAVHHLGQLLSPGMSSFRGVPRRPMASTTVSAR